MPNFFIFFKSTDEVRSFYCLSRGRDKISELWHYTTISKWKLIGDVNNIATYLIMHDCPHILGGGTLGLSIVKTVYLIYQKAKGNTCWYLKAIGKRINPILHLGSLFNASQSRSLSFEVYYSRAKPQREMAMLTFTKDAPRNVTRLCIHYTIKTTFL